MNGVLNVSSFAIPPYLMPCFRLPRTLSLSSTKVDHHCKDPGFLVELLVALLKGASRHFNYYAEVNFQQSSGYGERSPNGQWSGMVGDIVNNLSDVTLPTLFQSYNRSEVVDFIDQPLFFMPFCFIVNPFHVAKIRAEACFDSWSRCGLIVAYVCMVGTLMLRYVVLRKRPSQILDDIYNISFRQDYHSRRPTCSHAILAMLWSHCVTRLLFVLFASALYFQTQKPTPVPHDFSHLPHFLTQYKLFQHKATIFYNDLVMSNDDIFVRARKALGPHNFFPFENESIRKMMAGGEARMSYIACPAAKVIARRDPRILVSETHVQSFPMSMATRSLLPVLFKKYLSDASNRLRESGIVDRLDKKYFGVGVQIAKPQYALTIVTFSNTFMIFLHLCGVTILILLLELSIEKCKFIVEVVSSNILRYF